MLAPQKVTKKEDAPMPWPAATLRVSSNIGLAQAIPLRLSLVRTSLCSPFGLFLV